MKSFGSIIPYSIFPNGPMRTSLNLYLKNVIDLEKKQYNCPQCPLRKRFDNKPTSLLGRFWRWHINFCPGWKAYFASLTEAEKASLRVKYKFNKY